MQDRQRVVIGVVGALATATSISAGFPDLDAWQRLTLLIVASLLNGGLLAASFSPPSTGGARMWRLPMTLVSLVMYVLVACMPTRVVMALMAHWSARRVLHGDLGFWL